MKKNESEPVGSAAEASSGKSQLDRLCQLVQEHDVYATLSIEPGEEGYPGVWIDDIHLACGDSNCWHKHRFDPRTGHGFTATATEWQATEREQDTLKRALDQFEEAAKADYDCKPCREILAGKREYNR